MPNVDESLLPGGDLVSQGLRDLAKAEVTDYSLLVLIAGPRLRALGFQIPESNIPLPREHRLYERLEERLGPAAHSYYNSLLRRMDSFAHALEREQSGSSGKGIGA